MPKFSIIIPVYNVAPYLRECLDSVLAQTFTDWEAICVDDGSTDGSGAILDEYAARNSRFRVFHKENGGVSSARNYALDNIKGELVCFLDGDDMFQRNALDCIWSAFQRISGCDVIKYQHVSFESSRESVTSAHIYNADVQTIIEGKAGKGRHKLFRAFAVDYICSLCFHSRVVAANKIRFERFTHCEDSLFNLTCFQYLQKGVILSNVPLYFYRQREDSASHTVSFLQLKSSINVAKRMFEIAKEWDDFELLQSLIYKRIWQELAGHVYFLVNCSKINNEKKIKWEKYFYSALNWFYHQKGFHYSRIIQGLYCFLGFFSWRFVSVFLLHYMLIMKGRVVKILRISKILKTNIGE